MKALRIQVERVVRPIRASYLRKDRMREELLDHLMRLCDEERARIGDEAAAMTAAIRRFGDARALMAELQASVPWFERWAFYRIPYMGPIQRRPDESPLRYLVRGTSWGFAIGLIAVAPLAAVAMIATLFGPHRADRPNAAQSMNFFLGATMISCTAFMVLTLLSEGIRRAWECRAASSDANERRTVAWRIAGCCAASCALFGGSFAALMWLMDFVLPRPWITSTQFWRITLMAIAIGVPFTLLQAWSWRATTRRFENWDSLDLEEPSTT